MTRPVALLVFLFVTVFSFSCLADECVMGPQSKVSAETLQTKKYPCIVLYSVSWCPHCREAKEYLISHHIPFVNRDVEQDDKAMNDLTEKYKSTSVPLIVIGNDEKIIKGFNKDKFEKVLKEMSK